MVPKLVYDDDCHFCTWSATFAVRRSNIQPDCLSSVQAGESRLSDDERDRLPDSYEECVQLITEDAVYSCGAATEQSPVLAGTLPSELVDFLRQFEDYERPARRCITSRRTTAMSSRTSSAWLPRSVSTSPRRTSIPRDGRGNAAIGRRGCRRCRTDLHGSHGISRPWSQFR